MVEASLRRTASPLKWQKHLLHFSNNIRIFGIEEKLWVQAPAATTAGAGHMYLATQSSALTKKGFQSFLHLLKSLRRCVLKKFARRFLSSNVWQRVLHSLNPVKKRSAEQIIKHQSLFGHANEHMFLVWARQSLRIVARCGSTTYLPSIKRAYNVDNHLIISHCAFSVYSVAVNVAGILTTCRFIYVSAQLALQQFVEAELHNLGQTPRSTK